jgi:hypothetical protein
MKAAILFLLALLLPGAALAGDGNQLVKGAPVAIQPDMAYLLVRTRLPIGDDIPVDIVFVRMLSPDELNAAITLHAAHPNAKQPPNVMSMWWRDPWLEANGERTYVMAVKPGTYVLQGQAFGPPHGFLYDSDAPGMTGTCMCLGTVRFEAKAGTLTDLGTVLTARTDKPIAVPELAGLERAASGIVPMAMTVRPVSDTTPVPDGLKDLPRTPADYRAIGPLPNHMGSLIDRMAPVPGVLDYDKDGHVVDLKAKR